MNLRPARRHYTRAALELWLDRLASPWEHRFEPRLVEIGRELYRQGRVRDIAMTPGEVMIAGAWDDISAHVVFEWKEDGLHWRGSLDSPTHTDALAVAGLYELEELLCDETPALPPDRLRPVRESAAPVISREPAFLKKSAKIPKAKPSAPGGLRLVIQFEIRDEAALFAAKWRSPGGLLRPAFGPDAVPAAELGESARENLLRLVSSARKNRFLFDARRVIHTAESAESLPHFVREELPRWREKFRVEGAEELECLAAGVRELSLGATLSSGNTGSNAGEGADFSLEWRAGVGGEWLGDEITRRILRRGEGVTLVPGVGLVRLTRERATMIADWPDSPRGGLPRYLMLSLFREPGLKIATDPALIAWRDTLLAAPPPFAGMPVFLRPYQAAGVAWMAHLAARGAHPLLADEMGLGKTLQVLALILAVRPEEKPALIVCPASVVPVWRAEMEKFFPGTNSGVLARGVIFADRPEVRVWISGYAQLRRQKTQLETFSFGYAVLDEAQTIKNPDAKVTLACLEIRAAHRIALSGTPIENRAADLWALFRFLMPGLLGRRKHFEDGLAARTADSMTRLRTQIAPFTLRRTKREVATELPEKVEASLPCPLTESQREEYRKLVAGALDEFGDNAPGEVSQSMNFLSLLTRLRQAACDPGLLPWCADAPIEHSGKLVVLLDRLEEILAADRKAVVFSQFTSLLERLKTGLTSRFPDAPVFELTGATRDRAEPVEGFQTTKGAAIILVSLKAGGTGVTLTAGDYVFLLDPWWNPAVEAQAIDRVHRIGRERTVFVYRMTATDTIEDRIAKLKEAKRELFDRVVGDIPDLSDWRAHFPTLSSLIALSETTPVEDEPANAEVS